MVFYRKYRPQTIKDLDSEEIRNRLSSVLSGRQDSIPHAFLFTGPKGLGKTSAARIVAKVLNCERLASSSEEKKLNAKRYTLDASIEPCNKCFQCVSITNGTNMDVLEIDAASNRGIDEIRDLREKIKLLPIKAAKKVYIIDEVHMLTTEAFNALLKTLEEPPPHAVFILCTTEFQKVPATIVSRCSHLPFRRAREEELVRAFSRIAKEEKLPIQNEALVYLASLSDGSFRDGVKILEELALDHLAGRTRKKITKGLVEVKYQLSNINYQISTLLEFLAKKDTKRGLELVGKLVEQGVDARFFLEQLISELHRMLLVKVGVENSQAFSSGLLALDMEEIKKLIELLAKAHGEIKFAVLPQLPLELAIVEWGAGDKDALRSPSRFDESSNASVPASRHSAGLGIRPAKRGLVKISSHEKAPPASKGENNDSAPLWQELIEAVKFRNHSVAGVLRGCSLKSFDGKKLVIETGYKFHKERLEERKIHDILEKVCEEIAGKPVGVLVLLKERR